MNTQTMELSDSQLDAVSGGCYRPEPPKCEKKYYEEPKKEKKYCGGYYEEPKHHGWDWKEFFEELRKHY